MQQSMEFLTAEESAQVDGALLTSKDKFSTRLAIYSLRCLKQMAEETDLAPEEIPSEQITTWIQKDENIKEHLDVDANFETFFTRLVISSLRPLKEISQEFGVPLQDLTVQQVVKWYEKEGR
ncbi:MULTISPECIES: hypothetical protein [Okeania]|uniref:hypothetical protein n=1 Tax=Okeania TaxID=1458928 RepID=UPI000F535DB4|nr:MULTISPECIES: hypothetical protein [Okeania]NET13681.1 hypothetical protein [Okeania sp. SIO1H6]NES79341.1 hypothetical protein [Okeania sp. SIO1H4]NET21082.1 hypothetical protein [Okeania sp. SIO1H5]NET77811.1 hypothetical protein [Okeania sp. SIO1F9]NET96497.1 hypothetical protein [Okeania sp. SIO1H2]